METGSGSGSPNKVIPESVMEAVKRTSSNIDEVKANLEEFLCYCNNENLSRMEPLERAQALFLIAKANTTLFARMYLSFCACLFTMFLVCLLFAVTN